MASSTKPGTPRGMQPPDTKPVRITVPEGKQRYGDPFFPKVPFEALFPVTAVFIALLILAIASPAPLQDPADPLNHAAIDPRPEWYFMFLFQLLKYTPGVFIVLGTVIIPTILVILLLLVPFYDRNWARKINRRPVAAFSMTLGMLIVIFLTWGGLGFPKPSFPTTSAVAVPNAAISPAVAQIFQAHCAACHIATNLGGLKLTSYADLQAGGTIVPGQAVVIPGDHKGSILWKIIQPDKTLWPGGVRMPASGPPYLTDADINTIASWIDGLTKGGVSSTSSAPTTAPAATAAATTPTVGATAVASTSGTSAVISFKKDIQPLFQAHCIGCHIGAALGGLHLDNYQGLLNGGAIVAGSIIKPGNHKASYLWQILQPDKALWPGGNRMPLNGPYLSDAQIKTISDWIDQGAKDN